MIKEVASFDNKLVPVMFLLLKLKMNLKSNYYIDGMYDNVTYTFFRSCIWWIRWIYQPHLELLLQRHLL